MKKEDFGTMGVLVGAVACCLILTLVLTGSLSVIAGFFSGKNSYIVIGIILFLFVAYLHWRKTKR